MSEQQSSYRQIFKATSIFGGAQVFNILIGVIKSKATAIFLGADGVGILGLLNSAIELVRNITGLGVNISSVRDISHSVGTGDQERIVRVVTTVRRLCWVTGLLGMISMIILAPWLSEWTFQNSDYTWSFIFLSVVPLLTSISAGQLAVLQGLRMIMYLAKANMYGGAVSLLFLVPIYWCFGLDGIVPMLIIASVASLFFSFFFARKAAVKSTNQTVAQTYANGIGIIKLGFMLTLSSLIGSSASYAIRLVISNEGGLSDVGLYTAAYTIVVSYVGLVFTAMGADFFPRLASISDDNRQMSKLVNHQAEIGLLILAPMINFFIIFAPMLLSLLYSEKFTPATDMMRWFMLGVLFQAASWPLAFTLLAKAKNVIFLFKEIGSVIYLLVFSIGGYYLCGITGLGIGFVLAYVCSLTQISLINGILYKIRLCKGFVMIFLQHSALSVLIFISIMMIDNTVIKYSITIVAFIVSATLSYKLLDKRIGIRDIIKNRLKKKE